MVTLLNGLVGGLVATVVMTAAMLALGRDDPPAPSVLWAKYVADGYPEDYQPQGMVLHLAYGALAGGAFAALAGVLGAVSLVTVGSAVLWGAVWGVVLVAVAVVFWRTIILGLDPGDPSMLATQVGLHLLYGVVLAGWLSLDLLGLG